MKRAIAIGIGALLALAAIVYLRCHGDRESTAPIDAQESRARLKLRDLARRPPAAIAGVVSAGGAPVDGAIVCTRSTSGEREITCVVSGADGTYAFATLPPDTYVVWASHAGAIGRWRDKLKLAAGESKSGVDLVLVAAGAEIRGRVHDTRGRPVAGALVHVSAIGQDNPEQTIKTSATGAFSGRTTAGKIRIDAVADGFGDAHAVAFVPGDVDLLMIAEGVVSGIVVEADTRAPVPDARVSIGGDSTTTDDAGRFRIAKLSPGRYKPTARAIGRYGEAAETVLVRIGGTVDGVVIETIAVAVIAGKIAVAGGGTCPERAGGVQLTRRGAVDFNFGSTTGDGDVLVEGVVPGTYKVDVFCHDLLPVPPYPDLTIGNSDVEDVVWTLAPGARVTGRITQRGGGPLAEIMVVAHGGDGRDGGGVPTAADGTFEIGGLTPGPAAISIRQTGYAEIESVAFTADLARPARVDLALDRIGGALAGVVVDAQGKPVPSAEVYALSSNGGASGEHTDGRGEFKIEGLAPGAYVVTTRQRWKDPTDKPPQVDGSHAIKVAVGTAPVSGLRLVADPFAGAITGIVVDATGKPMPDVAVDVAETTAETRDEPRRRAWESALAYSGGDGTFRIDGLPDKTFDVRAQIAGAGEIVATGVALGARVRLALPATGTIGGVVYDPSGGPVDDVDIEIADRAQDISRSDRLFHTGGKFVFHDVPAGTYRATVDGDRQTSVMVTIKEGESRTDLRIGVRPRHALRGRLLAADRTPLAGWKIEVPHKEAPETTGTRTVITYEVETTITNARGEFLVEGLVGNQVVVSAGDVLRHPDQSMVEVRTIALAGASPVDAGDLVVPAKP